MQPLVLTLKGFRGIRDGLGRDELELDFEQLAGNAALVAIAGSNGRGKSTILDNMTPYPLCLRAPALTAWGAFLTTSTSISLKASRSLFGSTAGSGIARRSSFGSAQRNARRRSC